MAYARLTGRDGLPKSCPEALEDYMESAAHGIRATENRAGPLYPHYTVLREEDETGVDVLAEEKQILEIDEHDAVMGDPDAQVRMGQRHLTGEAGVGRDPGAAMQNFRQAADAGDPHGMFFLGYLRLSEIVNAGIRSGNGSRSPEDEAELKEAHSLLERASAAGVVEATAALGQAYIHSWGVQANVTKPPAGPGAAAGGGAAGAVEATFQLGSLLLDGVLEFTMDAASGSTRGIMVRDEARALRYLRAAYARGHWRAGYPLAVVHAEGRANASRSCPRAARFAKAVAEDNGDVAELTDAAHRAWRELRDAGRALALYAEAALLGSEVAQNSNDEDMKKLQAEQAEQQSRHRQNEADEAEIARRFEADSSLHRVQNPEFERATADYGRFFKDANVRLLEETAMDVTLQQGSSSRSEPLDLLVTLATGKSAAAVASNIPDGDESGLSSDEEEMTTHRSQVGGDELD
eukprot:tig00000733_g3769.t1